MTSQVPSITSARRYIDFLRARAGRSEVPAMPHCCVISYVDDISALLRARHPFRSMTLGITNPMQVQVFKPESAAAFAVARGMHGAPMAAVQMEELIALGCQEFLIIGPAGHPTGGPEGGLGLGDLVLATKALIFEGTSPHYGRTTSVAPSPGAVDRLATVLHRLELPHRQGVVASTDALYRETPPFITSLLEQGVLAIDMELSALCTVAAFHRRSIAGVLFVSDLVRLRGPWEIAPPMRVYARLVRQLCGIAGAYAALT